MPMLDIKCQSLCPDAARVVTNPVGVRPGLRPPHGALCGDNTLLIEFVLRIHAPGVAFLGQGCKQNYLIDRRVQIPLVRIVQRITMRLQNCQSSPSTCAITVSTIFSSEDFGHSTILKIFLEPKSTESPSIEIQLRNEI